MRALWLLAIAAGTAQCDAQSAAPRTTSRRVVVTAPDLSVTALEALRVEPGASLRGATRVGSRVELVLDAEAAVVLHAPEACARPLPAAKGVGIDRETVELSALIALSGPASDVGFDAEFEVHVRTGCAAALRGSLAWSLEGAPLARLSVFDAGYRVTGRTVRMPERLRAWPPGRVIPISPAERATTRLVARWTSPAGSVVQRAIVIHAAPRSRGLPDVASGERVPLSGSGYRVLSRPEGSHAEVMPWGRGDRALSSIVPDAPGRWLLSAADGRQLALGVSRYDAVPLDCGRTECHAAEAHAAQTSPMTAALSGVLEAPGAPSQVACTFGCHTTGEPGAADGGFSNALTDHELDPARLPSWERLPRMLRRSGGVGCLACHGPTQRPEESATWAILRADVCAYCHDAPPRYAHVRAWRQSPLALSDERVETRAEAACARCHTTWGFLASVTGKPLRLPPEDEPPLGVACVACHAVHSADAAKPGLLRRVTLPAPYDELPESTLDRSSACIACHTPGPSGGPSAALIWAGQGAEDPVSGAPIIGPAPHAAVPGGCVGCHGAASSSPARGRDHTFRADATRCSACHAERPVDRRIFDRARHLLGAAPTLPGGADPPHARPKPSVTPGERARSLVRLVLEDRGAAVHNPRYAAMLLERAAAHLAAEPPQEP